MGTIRDNDNTVKGLLPLASRCKEVTFFLNNLEQTVIVANNSCKLYWDDNFSLFSNGLLQQVIVHLKGINLDIHHDRGCSYVSDNTT